MNYSGFFHDFDIEMESAFRKKDVFSFHHLNYTTSHFISLIAIELIELIARVNTNLQIGYVIF